MGLRLAVATEDFGQPLRQAIQLAAQNPVQGLRLNARTEVRAEEFGDTALRQLRHYVEEHQLRVAGLMYSTRHSLCDEEKLDQRLDGIRSAMSLVRRLGTSELLIRVGRVPDPAVTESKNTAPAPSNADVDSLLNPFSFASSSPLLKSKERSEAEQFSLLCDVLNELAGHANRHGATLQLIVSSYDVSRLSLLLSKVTAGPVALVFDPATCLMAGQSASRIYRDLYRSVGYFRIRDAQKDIDGGGIETAFGDGAVDWMDVLPVIVESETTSWLCVERTGGDERASDVNRAIRQMKSLLPATGP
ncbi:MAG: sugar phosphate isomerase/epimerase [Planctomycetaceae bacterium]|nr:sugar phosphate isomerase/epimerase [Planctomycetaceae bacterium]